MKIEVLSRCRLEDCNRIIELVTEAQKLKRERQSETPIEKSASKWSVRLLGVAGASMAGLLALIPIVQVWRSRLIGDLAMVLGTVTELGAILSLLALIASQVAWFIRIRKHPATSLFDLVQADVSLYAHSVGELAIFGHGELQYVKSHFVLQREAFDYRRYFPTGQIEKIGLIPVLIGALTTAPKLVELLRTTLPVSWVWPVVALVVAFYVLSYVTQGARNKMTLAIALLDNAIELREALDKGAPRDETPVT